MSNVVEWFKERFPPINIISAYLLFAVTAAPFRHLQGHGPLLQWRDILLGLSLVCHFLLLRVIDEHKDFKQDITNHPERVLQRGLVNLSQLRVLGFISFLIPLGLIWFFSSQFSYVLIFWILVTAWTAMMSFEFFCSNWLRRHLLIYSVSHMMVLPLMILWALSMIGQKIILSDIRVYLFLGLVFCNGMIYEISRKAKGLDEIIEGEDSFTKQWGIKKTAAALFWLFSISFFLFVFFALSAFSPGKFFFIPSALTLLLGAGSVFSLAKSPTKKTRKGLEGAGALYVLSVYITCIVAAYTSVS